MKPTKPVRGIFLLTVFKILLASTFLAVFYNRGAEPQKLQLIAGTLGAYVLLAILTFISIHHFGAKAVRTFIVLAILASIPAIAVAGALIDAIALWLSFRPSVVEFFKAHSRSSASATSN